MMGLRVSEIFDIFKKRRTIIVDEEYVTEVLSVVNEYVNITYEHGLLVSHCGWKDAPTKWFILFYCIDKQWNSVKDTIRHIESVEIES